MVLTVGKEHNRAERSTLGLATCWAIPILSIYNYIVQGHCNQADKFVHNAADFLVARQIRYYKYLVPLYPYPQKIAMKH